MGDIIMTTKKNTLAQNKLICWKDSLRYAIVEPLTLKMLRFKFESQYLDVQKDPLVTVYIPTYNRAEILMERAVPSVLAQTYKNFELLIIGDCCTDKTADYVSNIKDSRVRFFNILERKYRYPPTVENHWLAGPVIAANKALELSKGKWIARVDDDDTWTPDHIESLLSFAQEGNYEFVSAQYMAERYGKQRIMKGTGARDPYYTRQKEATKGPNPLIGGTSTWLFRSYLKFIKYNINCWRKSWNSNNDIDYSLRIFKAGARIGFLPQVKSFVIPRPGEDTIGLDAYKADGEEKLDHFKF
jgi:glycosyltransferase involved in cell wall biosynthesis